jgi:hypothetical protein
VLWREARREADRDYELIANATSSRQQAATESKRVSAAAGVTGFCDSAAAGVTQFGSAAAGVTRLLSPASFTWGDAKRQDRATQRQLPAHVTALPAQLPAPVAAVAAKSPSPPPPQLYLSSPARRDQASPFAGGFGESKSGSFLDESALSFWPAQLEFAGDRSAVGSPAPYTSAQHAHYATPFGLRDRAFFQPIAGPSGSPPSSAEVAPMAHLGGPDTDFDAWFGRSALSSAEMGNRRDASGAVAAPGSQLVTSGASASGAPQLTGFPGAAVATGASVPAASASAPGALVSSSGSSATQRRGSS